MKVIVTKQIAHAGKLRKPGEEIELTDAEYLHLEALGCVITEAERKLGVEVDELQAEARAQAAKEAAEARARAREEAEKKAADMREEAEKKAAEERAKDEADGRPTRRSGGRSRR